ncbi:hypothetical protein [Pyrobaculum calidifontis]|uniref:Uncharacterized protein n=1 Tax=Pyrobaculum calidifontis (strain DSM 21063 / JCM 11548 / VA1) TaxID=410359 RepID=A3MST2_PYRCJ|nr:hypothetical protein [Pyrobaculum calidifontis]ABO07699.1 hypothetical protein Pcal_0262 [Pyrobaculum calidifontis JCM 11548]
MRQIPALGFEWQHVVAALSRHNVKELWLSNANPSHERVRGAVSELERVAKRMGVSSIHAVEVPTDDVRTRVKRRQRHLCQLSPRLPPELTQ